MKKLKKELSEIEKITRKKAIKKMGLVALSATTMLLLLNDPAKGADNGNSPEQPPEWP